ncbi:MAG: hypothetical protein ACRDCW_14900 [Sarcina sp.]
MILNILLVVTFYYILNQFLPEQKYKISSLFIFCLINFVIFQGVRLISNNYMFLVILSSISSAIFFKILFNLKRA